MNEPTTIGERVALLLEKVWHNNQRRMARDTKTSQPVISRTVHGLRLPSHMLLVALARQTGVDAAWLLTGEGLPFIADERDNRLDPPADSGARLGKLPFDLDHFDGMPNRDWYEIRPSDPVLQEPELAIRPGDRVLFESNPAYWQDNLQRLHGKVAKVTIQTGEGCHSLLGTVVCLLGNPDEPCKFFVDIFGIGRLPLSLSGTANLSTTSDALETSKTGFDKEYGKNRRAFQWREQLPVAARDEAACKTSPGQRMTGAELVAVGVCLLRRL